MAKNKERDAVPKMLRMAFDSANKGEYDQAWKFWQKAIDRGYTVQPKTERQLRMVIERSKRDLGLTSAEPNPPSADDDAGRDEARK